MYNFVVNHKSFLEYLTKHSHGKDRLGNTMENSCECGICGHHLERECLIAECKCCSNFHIRSGPK